ncbi:uncharacterized protein B0H18DRAFT_1104363 [Fomitopsis serialis]|uniref:uncharacterized protein n=1 Tax=Fomitopsis serialis TaxID=139415 RepID=UPI002007ADA6|nr:uncharacterized protein B0H18DRAFT_1104363 [Neoantrodia serialis]KAH9926801.1 hypothetical protein B0H18DRAFT_1104363 [Neoantrodia serialis]
MPTVLTSTASATSGDPYLLTGSYSWLDSRVASYIRIASVSIAAYDYVITLPAEWRFYKSQRSWRLSTGCILFILIRYISVAVLALNTVGFFDRFSPDTCAHYSGLAPYSKTMLSQIILGIRTINISRRSPYVTSIVAALFVLVTTGEWFTDLFHRNRLLPLTKSPRRPELLDEWGRCVRPVASSLVAYGMLKSLAPKVAQGLRHNCTVGEHGMFLSAWLYYLLAMIYDAVVLCISSFYLVRYGPVAGRLSGLVKLMLYDGLGYFVVLTAANILNLVLYRTSDILTQSSGAAVGEAVTWIMSQKLLIHLRDAAADANRSTHVVSLPVRSGRAVSRVMRSHCSAPHSYSLPFSPGSRGSSHQRKSTGEAYADGDADADGDVLAWSGTSLTDLVGNLSDIELDVQVEIQRTVNVEESCRGAEECGCAERVPCVVWVGNGARPEGFTEKDLDQEKAGPGR